MKSAPITVIRKRQFRVSEQVCEVSPIGCYIGEQLLYTTGRSS